MNENSQVVYVQPPAASEPLDPNISFKVVHTPFDTDAVPLQANEVLVKNLYLSIDPYHRFGLYDPAITQSQFPATKPGTIISTYGVSRVVRSANPKYAVDDLLYSWVRWERSDMPGSLESQNPKGARPSLSPRRRARLAW